MSEILDYQELNLKKDQILTAEHMAHIEEGIDVVTAEVAKLKVAKIVLRNDVTQEWTEVEDTVVLLQGEPAIEFTPDGLTKIKIGNGESTWKELPYLSTDATADVDFGTLTWGKISNSGLTDKGYITEALGFKKLGYGDKADIAPLNTNIDLTEQYLLDLEAGQTQLHEQISTINQTVETSQTAANTALEASTANTAAITTLQEDVGEAVTLIDERLDVIEGGMHHVDYLVGELTNGLEETDAPIELVDMRVDTQGNTFSSAGAHVRAIEQDITKLKENLSDYVDITVPDGLIYEGNKLYLASKGQTISDPVEIIGGGSGGGNMSGGQYTITLTNLLENRYLSVTKDQQVIVKFRYISEDDDGYRDGAGIGNLIIDGVRKLSTTFTQGDNELDITPYLAAGKENSVQLRVTNTEGYYRTLSYTVNVVALTLTTNFPNMSTCEGDVAFQYRVTGIGDKKIYFFLDGRDLKSETITADDVTRTKNIPAQADGAHYLNVYVESKKDGVTVRSEELNIGLMWKSKATTSPMVMLNYTGDEKREQGEVITIPYLVFDPHHLSAASVVYTIYNEDNSIYYTRAGSVEPIGKEWNVQDYPAGNVKFEITCNGFSQSLRLQIKASDFNNTIIRDDSLLMEFTAQNRSNSDVDKDQWSYKGYVAEFENFSWTDVDGWLTDSKGGAVLRFLPANSMFIPFEPFDNDIRATGYTIEVELASHNVRDYDSTLITSFESNRGFIVKSQNATLQSQSSGTSVQFKEDERIRVTFVVAKDSTNRLIYIYINGILCSVTPYPSDDNFKQPNPIGITIGADDCGLDLYALRFYNRAFNAKEQLNNFICDRSTIAERIAAHKRNDILDLVNTENEEDIVLSYDKVQSIIPIMVMRCAKLPADKDNDKFKGQHVDYIDLLHPEYSFTADDCTFQVQGTSSAKYPVKNFKIKLGSGLTYTQSGETAKGWLFDKENSIETKVFCLKADFASSEHSNNVNLVDYYNDITPYKMPAQEVEPKVRQGINGRPIILFWENAETGELQCQGSYNLNDDKSNEKTFGFKDIDVTSIIPEPRIECWEWCNNNNPLVLFKNSNAFYETKVDEKTGKEYPAWHDDLEPRFPDLDDHYYGDEPGEIDRIKAVIDWVISTDPDQATGAQFEEARYYPHYQTGGLARSFTHDNADYRLSKFKAEFEQHFILNAMLFYYLFTETFLLMDSRAKNMFLTTFDGYHYFPIPYDMDTAMGINNEGTLSFDYNCEDTDLVNDEQVFTGQESVLWNNVRKCFQPELVELYKEVRANPDKPFSYEEYIKRVNDHQEQWSEMCWNYDAQFKYLDTYERGHASLAALQGNKKSQREWWLYNAFKYRDSKYHAGDASKNYILIRTNGHGQIDIVPYSHIYAEVEWGEAKTERKRATRNETVSFDTSGIETVFNLETHIFSADRIVDVGDLSPLQVGYCDVSAAKKLQRLLLGSTEEGYRNGNLRGVVVSQNELLREIDVSNCYDLGNGSGQGDTRTLDVTACPCLEIFRGHGTALKGVEFSNGGRLKEVYLPGTIASLILRNQKQIEVLDVESYENVATLGLTNIPNMNIEELVSQMPKLDRIALENVSWTASSAEALMATITKLSKCDGLKIDGTTLPKQPILTGRVYIDDLSDELLQQINLLFPGLTVVVAGVPKFFIRYRNYYNEIVYSYVASEGEAAIDPTNPPEGWPDAAIPKPEVPETEDTRLIWTGWRNPPSAIYEPYDIVATYDGQYRVQFYSDEGELYEKATQWIDHGQAAEEPVANGFISTPSRVATKEYHYEWTGWDRDYSIITGPADFYPTFQAIRQKYLCTFKNDGVIIGYSYTFYNELPSLPEGVDANNIYKEFDGEPSKYYDFIGWQPSMDVPITQETVYEAQFLYTDYIQDSWDTIISACKSGNVSKYDVGARKKLNFTMEGVDYEVDMEIAAKSHDDLVTISSDYNNGADKASLTFVSKNVVATEVAATTGENKTFVTSDGITLTGITVGGWENSLLRNWMNASLFGALPMELRTNIKTVKKLSDLGSVGTTKEGASELRVLHETEDVLWAPSVAELARELASENVLGQGQPYPVYTNHASRIKDNNGVAVTYWTRSAPNWDSQWIYITEDGDQYHRTSLGKRYVCLGFCL